MVVFIIIALIRNLEDVTGLDSQPQSASTQGTTSAGDRNVGSCNGYRGRAIPKVESHDNGDGEDDCFLVRQMHKFKKGCSQRMAKDAQSLFILSKAETSMATKEGSS